ncbi:MAG TPA: hypothetical protein VFE47_05885 [Tepidisphaeraceae bacterium]|jgi:hypothetical protein|nr:hypothetical protein [Tepidisphaeraceae bacterium]
MLVGAIIHQTTAGPTAACESAAGKDPRRREARRQRAAATVIFSPAERARVEAAGTRWSGNDFKKKQELSTN